MQPALDALPLGRDGGGGGGGLHMWDAVLKPALLLPDPNCNPPRTRVSSKLRAVPHSPWPCALARRL